MWLVVNKSNSRIANGLVGPVLKKGGAAHQIKVETPSGCWKLIGLYLSNLHASCPGLVCSAFESGQRMAGGGRSAKSGYAICIVA
jgi:hypothetical protein